MAEKKNIKDKLENLKEGHRKSNKDIIESLFAILGYLKNNTDVDNPTSQTQMLQGGGNKRISWHKKYISQQNGKHGDSP